MAKPANYYTQRRRSRLRSLGLCVSCGIRSPKPTSILCDHCTKRGMASRKELVKKRAARGQCTECRHPAVEGMKMCAKCAEEKRLFKLNHRYGLTADSYRALAEAHDWRCAICGGVGGSRKQSLDVDHCHGSGVIRGLLCRDCNQGLGHFRDSKELLMRAIEYLRAHESGRSPAAQLTTSTQPGLT